MDRQPVYQFFGCAFRLIQVWNLIHLVLQDKSIWDQDLVDYLVPFLKQNVETFTGICIEDTFISNEGVKALAEFILISKNLITLSLARNKFGPSGLIALAHSITNNKSLTEIDLDGNKFNYKSYRVLALALRMNCTLTRLSLNQNNICESAAKALASALKVNKTLIEFNLSFNNIGDEGAKYFADALKINTNLLTLNLMFNNISNVGCKALSDALLINKTLKTLFIQNSWSGASSIATGAFMECMKINVIRQTDILLSETKDRNMYISTLLCNDEFTVNLPMYVMDYIYSMLNFVDRIVHI